MDIFVSEIKDTASDMPELMNIVGVVPENILQVKDIFKRQCMAIATNTSNYKIDSLQIRALVKENYGKTDIPSCSSDEQMMDLISEKEETIEAKETYSFRPQSDKTSSFEKIIQNPIVQDPDINLDEIRYWYEFGAINSIYLTPPDFPETTLKRDFRTYEGESKFSPVMIAPAKKSPLGAIMYLQQRMKMIVRSIIKSSPDAQSKFFVQRSHARQGGGICPAYSKNKEVVGNTKSVGHFQVVTSLSS
ncbi:hypothetical protein Tco_1308788 [Tanacetum coccineum]